VLLLDAGFSQPQLIDLLGRADSEDKSPSPCDPAATLAHFLRKERDITDVAVRTRTSNLWVAPSDVRQGREPLYVDPLVINRCRQRFSVVLVSADTEHSPAAIPLARQCDAAYLVVDLGRTDRQTSFDAMARLERGGVPVLGCIATGAPAA
jgi:hypothetical protein